MSQPLYYNPSQSVVVPIPPARSEINFQDASVSYPDGEAVAVYFAHPEPQPPPIFVFPGLANLFTFRNGGLYALSATLTFDRASAVGFSAWFRFNGDSAAPVGLVSLQLPQTPLGTNRSVSICTVYRAAAGDTVEVMILHDLDPGLSILGKDAVKEPGTETILRALQIIQGA